MACKSGGTVSVVGVYGGFIDKFPIGAPMQRSLRIMTGQCHVQRYTKKLLKLIQSGDIDPSFVITHHMRLQDAPLGYGLLVGLANPIRIILPATRPMDRSGSPAGPVPRRRGHHITRVRPSRARRGGDPPR
jgi:threonine dehydrogenase-like Zn-dependent dehydrogenase